MMGWILRKVMFLFDAFLRWVYRVEEFSKDSRCLFRISLKKSKKDLILPDGTDVRKGDPVVELHYWNEHMPPIPQDGPDMEWGIKAYKNLLFTLFELDSFMAGNPKFRDVKALTGETTLMLQKAGDGLLKRLGFEVIQESQPLGVGFLRGIRYFKGLLSNCYWWALVWAFNPSSLKRKRFGELVRCSVWISRRRIKELIRDLRAEKVSVDR
jgi:hypothetical protein